MLPPADPMGTRPLRAVEPATPTTAAADPRREVFDRLTQIALGKTFQAEVLSRLNDGTYLIKLDNAALRAALPGNPQIGAALSLKFIATQPRPTFLIMQSPDADTTTLSSAAKLIDSILHAATGTGTGRTEAVAGKAAILPGLPNDPSSIASVLKHTLASSGVFYESHLSQWADGSRPLSALQQEPQANMKPDNVLLSTLLPSAAKANAAQLVDVVATWNGAAPAAVVDAPSNELMQLLNLQLQTLEQQKIVWHGELWPGQPLEWEVGQDQEAAQGESDSAASWTSTVRFSLPSLGTVAATISLMGEHMHMQLRAANEDTAHLLRERSVELTTALDAAGTPLEGLSVKQDEQA